MHKQDKLMERIASPENLLAAWRSVRGNIPLCRRQRSAGPDGITLVDFEQDLPAQLYTLRHMLLKNRYEPQSPGLISIEKRGGGSRQIAILNIVDRVAQRAAQQVLEPIYEPNFLPCSFGFRPGRSLQDAVYCAQRLREHGYAWVVDGDISNCFDSLDHHFLLQQVGSKTQDARVLDLLQKWLESGMLAYGQPAEKPDLLTQGWKKTSQSLSRGIDWSLRQFNPLRQPYPASEHTFSTEDRLPNDVDVSQGKCEQRNADALFDEYMVDTANERKLLANNALRQMAAGGLVLAVNWARRGLATAGPTALTALKSQTGQEILKRGLLAGGGMLGAAAGVVVASCLVYRKFAARTAGVLQGSPLSPLLANIYLHDFDLSITHSGFRMVRYADDWVILCPDQHSAETAYNQSILALAHIHLKINTAKTHIIPPTERLEWLGEMIT